VTRFWWIRHGPTHQKVFCGWNDVPADLSDHAALQRLRDFLPDAPVISSDLIRARATGDAIQNGRQRLTDDPDLREFHYGDWEGLDWQAVAKGWPDLSREYWERPGDAAPPGGESWNAGALRVGRAVDRLLQLPEVIVVAHMGVILTQLQRAWACSAAEVLAQTIAPLSVTELDWDGQGWRAGRINHCP
jgi:alpha-ribazole phosphatase